MHLQSTDRKLFPDVRRDSFMRNSYQPDSDTPEHRRLVADETSPTVVASGQPQPALAEQSWIERALSWLGSCLLEGSAAYGESLCHGLPDHPEDAHARTAEPHRPTPSPLPKWENPWSQSVHLSHDVDFNAWLASAPSQTDSKTGVPPHRRSPLEPTIDPEIT
jgi:hypothetical protein